MKPYHPLMILLLSSVVTGCSTTGNNHETESKNRITGYDGIPFGTKHRSVPQYLSRLEKVDGGSNNPIFEQVPGESYYRYYVTRDYTDSKGEEAQSEVSLIFKWGKLIQFRDTFGGWYQTDEEVHEFSKPIIDDLIAKWGEPTSRTKEQVIWVRNGVTARFIVEMSNNPCELPIVELYVFKESKSLFPAW